MTFPNGSRGSLTLLLSSAGRRVELLRRLREDAAVLGIELEIVATDMDAAWSSACRLADARYDVPPAGEPAFIERTLSICEQHDVDIVLPTIDTELELFARHAGDFRARGTEVVISSLDLVKLARDKLRTAEVLAARDIPVPRSATPEVVMAQSASWPGPLIMKPRGGSSSRGLRRLETVRELSADDLPDGYLIQELLEGDEYTINLYFGPEGQLRCVIPHLRREVRAGEVSKGVTRRHQQIEAVGWAFGKAVHGARGPLCIQAIITPEGRVGMFEINARIGGGYPLAHAAGARFTQWLLEEAAGLPSTASNDWQAGVTMLRYDAAVIVRDEG